MRHLTNCTVLRPAGFPDCTGGGITARHAGVTVITDVPYLMTEFNGHRYFDRPDEKAVLDYVRENGLDPQKVVILCDRQDNPVYTPFLKPLDSVYGLDGDGNRLTGPCAGGNYVRFRDGNDNERVVRVHDRYDTQEAWDALSR
jgi:hypothetical protein